MAKKLILSRKGFDIPQDRADRRNRTERIGNEREPVVVVDAFADDPDDLRAAATAATFDIAEQHYPGIRAPLPPDYLGRQLPIIARALGRTFGRVRRLRVIDAGFAIVTTAPDRLHVRQRLPHVDAYGADRIALVHYLSPDDRGGTAFFRHRATGFETVDETRAAGFFAQLRGELDATAAPPSGYIAGDTDLFERIAQVEARYNRAALYRSYQLHSGMIAPDSSLSSDPATGRLTITAFLAIE